MKIPPEHGSRSPSPLHQLRLQVTDARLKLVDHGLNLPLGKSLLDVLSASPGAPPWRNLLVSLLPSGPLALHRAEGGKIGSSSTPESEAISEQTTWVQRTSNLLKMNIVGRILVLVASLPGKERR